MVRFRFSVVLVLCLVVAASWADGFKDVSSITTDAESEAVFSTTSPSTPTTEATSSTYSSSITSELTSEETSTTSDLTSTTSELTSEETLTTSDSTSTTSEATSTSPAALTSSETDGDDDERVSYEGAQLLRVDARSTAVREDILRLEDSGVLETWHGMSQNSSTVDVFVAQENEIQVKKYLRENNVNYKIAIKNIQTVIDAENVPGTNGELEVQSRAGHPMTWNAYHSLDDIYAYMDYLVATYTSCKLKNIGTSVEGRPIKAMEITLVTGTNKPTAVYFIDGGMHAREWISISSVLYMMKEIAENKAEYVSSSAFNTGLFVIIPVLNPDGYEYSRTKDRLWRKNRKRGTSKARGNKHERHQRRCDGVDLNRNFGHKWGGAGSSGNECKETYRGTTPFSEPETKAYKDYAEAVKLAFGTPFVGVYLSYHSYGQSITFPWSYDRKVHDTYQKHQNRGNDMASKIKSSTSKVYKVGSFAATFYPASGTSTDWFIEVGQTAYSYTIELRDKGRFGFLLPGHEVTPTGLEAMRALVSFL